MNKLPTKQIYLLFIIIVGIIALSVYSTYALFTFESSTSDIVTIHTPKSLKISENVYEYQQLTIAPNTVTTTDVDIYNAFDYEVCYSVWYKVLGGEEIQSKVQIFEQSKTNLTSSGVVSALETIRVKIVIINDNDTEIKINLGTIGSQKKDLSCSLNLTDDKSVIGESYENFGNLIIKLQEDSGEPKEIEENYLIHHNIIDNITLNDTDKIYISDKFQYSKESFSLIEPKELTFKEIIEEQKLNPTDIYFCKDFKTECSILHKLIKYEVEELELQENEELEEKRYNYHIKEYDKMIGYSKSSVGLRKINATDYVFYGDNPNNYVYYNCVNNDDLSTCEVWRIIGFYYNEKENTYHTKIVRNKSIGKYQFDFTIENDENKSTNIWNNTSLHKYLNEEYKFLNNYDIYLEEIEQKVERIPSLDHDIKNIKIKEETYNSKISLLTLSDYLYASSCEKKNITDYTDECLTNNWLNDIEINKEWTLTSKEVEIIEEPVEEVLPEINNEIEILPEPEGSIDTTIDTEEIVEETPEPVRIINYTYSIGSNIEEHDVNDLLEVRPVVFLKSRILVLAGDGSFENPYVIK